MPKPLAILQDMPPHIKENIAGRLDFLSKISYSKVSHGCREAVDNHRPEYVGLGIEWTSAEIYITLDFETISHSIGYSNTPKGCRVQRSEANPQTRTLGGSRPAVFRNADRYDLAMQGLKWLMKKTFVTKELNFVKQHKDTYTDMEAEELTKFYTDIYEILSNMKTKPIVTAFKMWMNVEHFLPLVCPQSLEKVIIDGGDNWNRLRNVEAEPFWTNLNTAQLELHGMVVGNWAIVPNLVIKHFGVLMTEEFSRLIDLALLHSKMRKIQITAYACERTSLNTFLDEILYHLDENENAEYIRIPNSNEVIVVQVGHNLTHWLEISLEKIPFDDFNRIE